ncbi:hypothetical protein B0H63DRAFT_533609 [Podospora didyma]|uniref:RRM domain-containing protein n=1 Tax=Podospora didyma TaxID=330526 RepID=A0AAE0P861_9PEZI|nr:hypothetical protein B0H63DRAFT_533609 [Podospora didyma]
MDDTFRNIASELFKAAEEKRRASRHDAYLEGFIAGYKKAMADADTFKLESLNALHQFAQAAAADRHRVSGTWTQPVTPDRKGMLGTWKESEDDNIDVLPANVKQTSAIASEKAADAPTTSGISDKVSDTMSQADVSPVGVDSDNASDAPTSPEIDHDIKNMHTKTAKLKSGRESKFPRIDIDDPSKANTPTKPTNDDVLYGIPPASAVKPVNPFEAQASNLVVRPLYPVFNYFESSRRCPVRLDADNKIVTRVSAFAILVGPVTEELFQDWIKMDWGARSYFKTKTRGMRDSSWTTDTAGKRYTILTYETPQAAKDALEVLQNWPCGGIRLWSWPYQSPC